MKKIPGYSDFLLKISAGCLILGQRNHLMIIYAIFIYNANPLWEQKGYLEI